MVMNRKGVVLSTLHSCVKLKNPSPLFLTELSFQSSDSRGSRGSESSCSPDRGGARRRKASGRGRKTRDSSESEESDVSDMNRKTKESDQDTTSKEGPSIGKNKLLTPVFLGVTVLFFFTITYSIGSCWYPHLLQLHNISCRRIYAIPSHSHLQKKTMIELLLSGEAQNLKTDISFHWLKMTYHVYQWEMRRHLLAHTISLRSRFTKIT